MIIDIEFIEDTIPKSFEIFFTSGDVVRIWSSAAIVYPTVQYDQKYYFYFRWLDLILNIDTNTSMNINLEFIEKSIPRSFPIFFTSGERGSTLVFTSNLKLHSTDLAPKMTKINISIIGG